ncbi:ChrR family anti-sigma-E factor [Niveispirillum irakense]|uniref:ChrR family anti-sigma-E factor n=1 Tax=Niveispirillum irakense TaxID=34011 RepID=UPI0004118312|nr:ChrR family anti-sigma-E factor [Niveispirillum irakense]
MSASFHPSDELLVAYGAGSLDEATALLVASHLTLCPRCRSEVARIEAMGGNLLEELPPAPMGGDALADILARLDDAPVTLPPPPRKPARATASRAGSQIPAPLRAYLGGGLENVRWKRLTDGLEHALVVESGRTRARLYRIAPGIPIPEHGHGGAELTLVLQGGFSDHAGHYLVGDVACADDDTIHHPVADTDGHCICLAVTDAPLKLTGLVGRLISRFLNL